jgi:hypothetical protein
VIVVIIIIIVVLLKLVFAVFAIGPVALEQHEIQAVTMFVHAPQILR